MANKKKEYYKPRECFQKHKSERKAKKNANIGKNQKGNR